MIDVAIALVLTFALTALAASAVVEWIGNLTHKRAKYLLRGLRNMLDAGDHRSDPATPGSPVRPAPVRAERRLYDQALHRTGKTVDALADGGPGVEGGLTALLFDHPLLRATMQPEQSADGRRSRVPPYLPAETFSRALIDTLVPGDAGEVTMAEVQAATRALAAALPARQSLLALQRQSGDQDLDGFRAEVERWYDAQMDRVSGWYKRWAQRWLIVVAAALCLFANIDAYAIASTLYRDPVVRSLIVGQVQQGQNCAAQPDPTAKADCVRDLVAAIDGTTRIVGWPANCPGTLTACVPTHGSSNASTPALGSSTPGPSVGASSTPGPSVGASSTPGPSGGTPSTPGPSGGTPSTPGPSGGTPSTPGPSGGTPSTPGPSGGSPGVGDWLVKLLGLVATTAAAAMGAPFWFGALNRLVNLRLTGNPPQPAA